MAQLQKKMGRVKDCLANDRKLLPVKVHYFLFLAALACALPFRTVFAKQLGISATELGVVFCAVPLLRTVSNPLFGFILDYFKKIRLTISLTMVFVAISLLALIFIPPKSSTIHNRLNITENDFYTKVKYLCHNETCPYACGHKLLMYSEYGIRANSAVNSFACDMECLDLNSGNEKDMLKYSPKMKFDLKVLVDISNCEMNIRLPKGDLIVTRDNVQNLVPVDVNNTSIKRFKSRISPFQNCSTEATTALSSARRTRKKTSAGDLSDLVEVFENGKEYVSISVPDNSDGENRRHYVLHEYRIKVATDDFLNGGACSTEFDCTTKNCFLKPGNGTFNPEPITGEDDEFMSVQFWSLFVLFATSSVMFSAVMFMMDAACYELLQSKRDQYGQQRLFGSIGWGIGALVGGFLNHIAPGESGETDYTLSFYLLAVLIAIDLYPVYQLKVTDLKYSSHILKDVCLLFTKFDLVYNLIIVCIVGLLSGFIWNYQFWFMEEIGSGQVLLGLSQTSDCLFEIPWFVVSGWIINKFGHDHCNSFTLLCFGIRYLCFVFMYNPWWTLATGFFNGPTFGLFYASLTMYAKNKAPPGTEATVQSLQHLAFEGLGAAIGSILGGVGIDKFGSRMSFLYAAELSFCLFFINIIKTVLFLRAKKKTKKIEQPLSSVKERY